MDPISVLEKLIKFPTYQVAPDKVALGMKDCALYLSECLDQNGFEVDIDKLHNVTAIKEFDGKRTFLINTHFDTVAPAEGWEDALNPKVKGDRLYGLGASDAKGGIAAILHSLSLLKECQFAELIVQFVNYEDNAINYRGTRWLGMPYFLSKNPTFTADYGINVEPSIEGDAFSVGVGCTGRLAFNIRTIGKEAHSSTPNEGKNAIYDMAKVIEVLRQIPHGKYTIGGLELEMPINIAKIEGGRAINIVPEECKIACERRLFPGENSERIEKRIRSALKKVKEARIESSFRRPVQLPYAINDNEEIVSLVKNSILETLGYPPQIRIKLGRTDSTYLYHKAGIKTVIVGPGHTGHIKNEHININRLLEFTRILKNLLQTRE
ncbi:MAG: M20/M25/M40 family metallo-hydrolase [Candidatus Bathyarchaeota archaeon]|nr:MAG: M20/M25/M40 family metallo-hydrolase [Candidatus Bathyarchaeota archaeon]